MTLNLDKLLPDFEDMFKLIELIGSLTLKKLACDTEIKLREADVIKKVSLDPTFWQGKDKPPAYNYIESTWKITGIEGELLPLRAELVQTIAELEKTKLKYEVLKLMVEVWRTASANERAQP
jgi:hypothetical protein